MADTNITDLHREQFDAIRDCDNIALFSGTVNGEPTAIIVAVNQETPGGMIDIVPLFVAVTPGMVLTDHDGNPTLPHED